jgi:hypothetical protein
VKRQMLCEKADFMGKGRFYGKRQILCEKADFM